MSSLFSIGGLASGLDTNSIVDQLIALERRPIGRLEVRKSVEKRQIDALTTLTTKLSGVRTELNKLDGLLDWRAFRTATSSNEDVATIKANAGAQPQSIGFTVLQLAQTHQVRDTTSYADGNALYGDGTLTITLDDGTVHDVDTTGKTLAQVREAVHDLSGVRASIVGLTGGDRLVITSEKSGASGAFAVSFTGANTFATVTTGQDALIDLDGNAGTTDDQAVSSSNTFTSFLQNTSITVKSLGSTTVTIDHDVTAAADRIEAMVTAMNDLFTEAAALTKFGGEDSPSGPLIGNAMVRDLVNQLRTSLTTAIADPGAPFRTAGAVGVSLTREGGVTLDRAALETALRDDFDGVAALFQGTAGTPATPPTTTTSATSDSAFVAFSGLTPATQDGAYTVVVNAVAQPASVEGASFTISNANGQRSTYRVTVDGQAFDLGIQFRGNGTYTPYNEGTNPGADAVATTDAQVVQIFQDFLAAKFGAGTITASDSDPTGAIRLKMADGDLSGSISVALIAGTDYLGLNGASGAPVGADVTINGTQMTAVGNTVTAPAGHPAEGLELTIDPSTPASHSATVTVTTVTDPGDPGSGPLAGLASQIDAVMGRFEGVDGRIKAEKDLRQSAIDLFDDRIDDLERRIELRAQALRKQFTAMETALSLMQQQLSSFLGQLNSLPTSQTLNRR